MYHITLYENGHFCSHVGGAVPTLPEALKQMQVIASTLKAEEYEGYLGYKFDRCGTDCALIITDRWQTPIFNIKNED